MCQQVCSLKYSIWSCSFFISQHISQFSMVDFQPAQKVDSPSKFMDMARQKCQNPFSDYAGEQKTGEIGGNAYSQRLHLTMQNVHKKHCVEISWCKFSNTPLWQKSDNRFQPKACWKKKKPTSFKNMKVSSQLFLWTQCYVTTTV